MKDELKDPATRLRSTQNWQDLCLACLFGSVFVYVFSRTVADPDLWGHLKFGQDLWRTGKILRGDIYSYVTGDQLWINHEWLAEGIFYSVFAIAGTSGLVAFKCGLALMLTGIIYTNLKQHLEETLRAGILTIVFSLILFPYLVTIRPQAFTMLMFLIVLILLQKADKGELRWLWFLPLVVAVGVNLHGGFLASLGVFLLWATTRLGQSVLRQKRLAAIFAESNPVVILVALVATAATLLNPYGIELPLFLLRTATVARPEIGEWRPIGLMSFQGAVYVLLLVLAITGLVFSKRERSHSLVILAGTAILPLVASRHVPLFGLAAAVLAGEHVGDVWEQCSPKQNASGTTVSRAAWLWKLYLLTGLFLVGVSLPNFACIRIDARSGGPPATAVALIKQSGASGNMAVHFDWGEYVLWHLGPKVKVSVDGRRETVYSKDTYNRSLAFMFGLDNWDAILTKVDTELALVSKGFPVFNLMKMKADWQLVYEDPATGLFARRGSHMAQQIENTKVPELPYDGAGSCFP
jgi:hypothetical protein